VHDGIQGDQPGPRAVRHVQGAYVALTEGERGVVLPGLRDHLRRQVDADGCEATLVEIAAHLARPAADVAHRPMAAHLLREAVQQGAIQRLVR